MKNVLQLMREVLQKAGLDPDDSMAIAAFRRRSSQHRDYWRKLTGLFIEKGVSAEDCANVDEATLLEDSEYAALFEEGSALDS